MIQFYKKSFVCCILLSTCLVSVDTLALGGLGSGHKSKSSGSNGVLAMEAIICSNMDCPQSKIKMQSGCGTNQEDFSGVCRCIKGYKSSSSTSCVECNIGDECSCGGSKMWSGTTCVECIDDTKCSEGQVCSSGSCVSDTSCGTCPTGTYCHQGECYCSGTSKIACGKENDEAICCEEGSICSINSFEETKGTCTKPASTECLGSEDCPEGQYCSFDNGTDSSSAFNNGHCVALGDTTSTTHYVYSHEVMDWWSAKNWCKEKGLKMAHKDICSGAEADLQEKDFSDSNCTVSELQAKTEETEATTKENRYFHFWLYDSTDFTWIVPATPQPYEQCYTSEGEIEYTGAGNTYCTDNTYAYFISPYFKGIHYLHKDLNFLARALCVK